MHYSKIRESIDTLEQDALLQDDDNFIARIKALDFLEFQVIDAIEQLNSPEEIDANSLALLQRARLLKHRLDTANERLFTYLLTSIRSNDRSILKDYLRRFEPTEIDEAYVGYDELDTLIWALLETELSPEEPKELEPDMVFYQPSSARTILKFIRELHTTPDDVLYDLGSGLGHVPILVNLLTGIHTKGVEIQEFYWRLSNACLNKLELADIEFRNADARDVDYDDGTIFYMYTPFRGKVLRQVLAKLQAQSKRRQIQICTFGPCTLEVAEYGWLHPVYRAGKNESSLAIFCSA